MERKQYLMVGCSVIVAGGLLIAYCLYRAHLDLPAAALAMATYVGIAVFRLYGGAPE